MRTHSNFSWNAVDLSRAIRNGDASSEEVVAEYIRRIEHLNPVLNAVIHLRDEAIEEAREADKAVGRKEDLQPLHGVPVTIKDSFDLEGLPTTSGTIGRIDRIASEDATSVSRLKNAGAIILGKTNLPELCLAYETDNRIFGRTNNPYNHRLTSGGSSGGEAAIIAAGGSPLGLGSDSGGSIRLPAHFCGICGLKPTSGAIPSTGHVPKYSGLRSRFMQPGPLAKRIADLSLALKILAGPDGLDPNANSFNFSHLPRRKVASFRVTYFTDNGVATPSNEVCDAIELVLGILGKLGFSIFSKRPDALQEGWEIFTRINGIDSQNGIQALLSESGTPISQSHQLTKFAMRQQYSESLSAVDVINILNDLDEFRRKMLIFMQDFDILICPVFPGPAFEHGKSTDPSIVPGFSYLSVFNLTGWPVVTLPVMLSDEGLPLGVQVIAINGRDYDILDLASIIEERICLFE